jgi:hypothetical protein
MFLTTLILVWSVTVLSVAHLLNAWFLSEIGWFFFKRPGTGNMEELKDAWLTDYPPLGQEWLGALVRCPVCLGTWLSLVCSVVAAALTCAVTGSADYWVLLYAWFATTFAATRLHYVFAA